MEATPSQFLAYFIILCFDRQCPEQNTVARLNKVFGPPKIFDLATLLLVTTFIQTACISLVPSHVPQYQTFHTVSTFLLDVQSSTDK